ncbi:hypothetical protein EZS27_009589 [termite gut metagenome]|uniref:Sialate O-acetylesterase domain-containing protein n=1 Tax=termite gut metagenome TaxID=433724 RepID=A0A5J4S9G6_9ZZZZ
MKNRSLKVIVLVALVAMCNLSVFAQVTLSALFSDNMVLQQQSEVPVWGKASPDQKVIVKSSWDGEEYQVTADLSGKWSVKLKTPSFGGPYEVIITSKKNTIKLRNILIGEVWVCSGQSNMEMPVAGWGQVDNYEQEIASADYPQIRLLTIEKAISFSPLNDLCEDQKGWTICSPSTIGEFSATAYFFGRNLHENLNVPIGLIHTSWGGTPAEAWMSSEALETVPEFKEFVKSIKNLSVDDAVLRYQNEYARWQANAFLADEGFNDNVPVWAAPTFNVDDWKEMKLPGILTENSLNNFDGVVWFRKTVTIPKGWQGRELTLKLAAIDDCDITYFNGVQIGTTEGHYKQRVYKIPARLVKQGNAVITVRLTDTGGEGGFRGNAEDMCLVQSSDKNALPISLADTWKFKSSLDFKKFPNAPVSIVDDARVPSVLFNAMLKPLTPFAIRGITWYQGEANSSRPEQYKTLLPLLILDWRKQWGQNLPFYYAQLANFNASSNEYWPELREAQAEALRLDNTGMAVTIDIGNPYDIHPKNKQDVGLRLALLARHNTYNEKVAFSGPVYQSYKIEENQIRIRFRHTNGGLVSKGDSQLKGFVIAGPDKKFYQATAIIDGNDVLVSAPEVQYPLNVRYAWENSPVCNLYNSADLPASPFRTDNWTRLKP